MKVEFRRFSNDIELLLGMMNLVRGHLYRLTKLGPRDIPSQVSIYLRFLRSLLPEGTSNLSDFPMYKEENENSGAISVDGERI